MTSSTEKTVEQLCLTVSTQLIPNGFLRGTYRTAVDTLLALAISQANLAPMARDLAFQKAYAGLSASPPDALRRPVPVRSIATSLGIPQETARRRVAQMIKAGLLAQTAAGVFMPKSMTETPLYLSTAQATWQAIGELYGALRRLGALGPPVHMRREGEVPYRYMMRLWGDHFLRLIEAILPLLQEPFDLVLLFAILRESQAESLEGGVVSASSLSRSLGLPFETVRRNAMRLAETGLCERTARGYLISPERLDTPLWRRLAERHRSILMRFFLIMDERELLGWWEADYRTASPPPL